jgi:hypothetical protein
VDSATLVLTTDARIAIIPMSTSVIAVLTATTPLAAAVSIHALNRSAKFAVRPITLSAAPVIQDTTLINSLPSVLCATMLPSVPVVWQISPAFASLVQTDSILMQILYAWPALPSVPSAALLLPVPNFWLQLATQSSPLMVIRHWVFVTLDVTLALKQILVPALSASPASIWPSLVAIMPIWVSATLAQAHACIVLPILPPLVLPASLEHTSSLVDPVSLVLSPALPVTVAVRPNAHHVPQDMFYTITRLASKYHPITPNAVKTAALALKIVPAHRQFVSTVLPVSSLPTGSV